MIIKFNEQADMGDTIIRVLNALAAFRIEGDYTNDGFPKDGFIVMAEDEGLTICDVDERGFPLENCTYQIGLDEINSITVL